jgi:hypothetical protein
MSNMIRGLPMQASTTQQYQAQPSLLTQGIGALGAGMSAYNAFNPPAKAKGGIISYDMGGEVESDLESASDEFLNRQVKESSSPSVKRMAQRILRERQMSKGPGMAGGGIIAFREPTEENNQSLVTEPPQPTASEILQQRVMQGKPTGDVMTQPQGIVQAPPPPPPPPPAPPPTREQVVQGSNVPAELKSMFSTAATEAGRTNADIRKEIEAEYEAAGVGQRNPEERANLMKERVNAEDEARRTRYLRMAEMFATWGTTPGPTLAAGLSAFKNTVPSLISDEKEATRVRKEIDKSLAGLDESMRLEKRGLVDKAADRKAAAVKKMEDIYTDVVKFKTKEAEEERANTAQEKRDVRTAEREEAKDIRYAGLQEKITQMKIDADKAIKKIEASWRVTDKSDQNTDRLLGIYRSAQDTKGTVENRISNIMKSEEYQTALANANAAVTSDSSPAAVKMQADAKAALQGFQESFKNARDTADKTVSLMEDQLRARKVNIPGAATAPTPGNRPAPKGAGARGATTPPLPPGAKLD